VHNEFIFYKGPRVKKGKYKEVLAHLKEKICFKCSEMWVAKDWMLLHDKATANQSLFLQ
jgi:hypothetical protein